MKAQDHRRIVGALQNEADEIRRQLLAELRAEGADFPQTWWDAHQWTGDVRVFGQTVWHLFRTPGSWDGLTYFRFSVSRDGQLRSREPEDFEEPPARAPFPPSEPTGDAGYPGLDLQG